MTEENPTSSEETQVDPQEVIEVLSPAGRMKVTRAVAEQRGYKEAPSVEEAVDQVDDKD